MTKALLPMTVVAIIGSAAAQATLKSVPSTNPPGIKLINEKTPGNVLYGFLIPGAAEVLLGHPVKTEADASALAQHDSELVAWEKHGLLRYLPNEAEAISTNVRQQGDWMELRKELPGARCWYTGLTQDLKGLVGPRIAFVGLFPPYEPATVDRFYKAGCQKKINQYYNADGMGEVCMGFIQCKGSEARQFCACEIVEPLALSGELGKPMVQNMGRCPSAEECLRQCQTGKAHDGTPLIADVQHGPDPGSFRWSGSPLRYGKAEAGFCLGLTDDKGKAGLTACFTTQPHCPSASECDQLPCTSEGNASLLPGKY